MNHLKRRYCHPLLWTTILLITVSTSQGKKKPDTVIPMEGLNRIAVVPFTYTRQKDFSREAGIIVAEALSEVIAKKTKLELTEMERIRAVMAEHSVAIDRQLTPDMLRQIAEWLQVDAVIGGQLSHYNEDEDSSYMPEGTSGYILNTREVDVTFEINIVRAMPGTDIDKLTIGDSERDTARDPMRPASPEILLERIAKSVAKKLCKSFTF
ncbi:hypothetical protein JXA40_03610 [bacterium]|nr:hypothetical protein [candidate division CSSED10-310 bacterium]